MNVERQVLFVQGGGKGAHDVVGHSVGATLLLKALTERFEAKACWDFS